MGPALLPAGQVLSAGGDEGRTVALVLERRAEAPPPAVLALLLAGRKLDDRGRGEVLAENGAPLAVTCERLASQEGRRGGMRGNGPAARRRVGAETFQRLSKSSAKSQTRMLPGSIRTMTSAPRRASTYAAASCSPIYLAAIRRAVSVTVSSMN